MFKIQSSNNNVLEHQMKKEIAGHDARKIMETQIKVNTAKINEENLSVRRYIDIEDARKNLKEYQRNYNRTCPESLDASAQNMMWKKAKQLKDEFSIGMLSNDELHPVKGMLIENTMKWVVDEERMRNTRAVERNTVWYQRNSQKIAEYKNIMRHLCPDNPGASDIERFRPKGGQG